MQWTHREPLHADRNGSLTDSHGRRACTARVLALGEQLTERERELTRVIADLRLATHAQLASLIAGVGSETSRESAARSARRMLARLTDSQILARLDRRIGGVRAGSSGYIYYLGPMGQRLVGYWDSDSSVRGRRRPEPGLRFVRHRLAVSELYVQARALQRAGDLDLLRFELEPECWRTYEHGDGRRAVLKPDAVIVHRAGSRVVERSLEVDLATESRPVIARKISAYSAYFGHRDARGQDAEVLFLAPGGPRVSTLRELCVRMPQEGRRLFTVGTLDRGLLVLRD